MSRASGAPAFPEAHNYGGFSPTTDAPPYDLSTQFNHLNIAQQFAQSSYDYRRRPPRQNSDVNKPLPTPPGSRPQIPNVLTPGNRQGMLQAEMRSPDIEYMPNLRNPVPRPPKLFPIPSLENNGSYTGAYSMPPQSTSAPPPTDLRNPWNNGAVSYSTPGTPVGAKTSRPSISAPNTSHAVPTRQRSSSVPPSPTASSTAGGDGATRCAGVTKAGKQCTRLVKAPPALGFVNPDENIPRYCFQHSKELLAVTGFYSRRTGGFVEFDVWIPKYLQEETKVLLRAEMEKPISTSDVDGYIYCYELRDIHNKDVVHLKVGRAVNLVKRIDEWTRLCESKEPILRGWYPGPDNEDVRKVSLMKGVVQGGRKGHNCHRLERLIHIELADLSIFKPYLGCEFLQCGATTAAAAPPEKVKPAKAKAQNSKPDKVKSPKGKATKAVNGKKTAKKSKTRIDSSEDDDEDEDYKGGDDEDEDNGEEQAEEDDDVPSAPSPVKAKKTKTKLLVRTPCKDCGQVHKEIFTFTRPTSGPLKGKEWDEIVHPVIEKWGNFIENLT